MPCTASSQKDIIFMEPMCHRAKTLSKDCQRLKSSGLDKLRGMHSHDLVHRWRMIRQFGITDHALPDCCMIWCTVMSNQQQWWRSGVCVISCYFLLCTWFLNMGLAADAKRVHCKQFDWSTSIAVGDKWNKRIEHEENNNPRLARKVNIKKKKKNDV